MINIYVSTITGKINSEKYIKYILNRFYNMDVLNITVFKNKYGKPYIMNDLNIKYNLSHSRGLIVCAVSDSEIGIDVEKVRAHNRSISHKWFSNQELDFIDSSGNDQDMSFFQIWTKKEAKLKWKGTGINTDLLDVNVIDDSYIKTLVIEDYVISICSDISIHLDDFAISWVDIDTSL